MMGTGWPGMGLGCWLATHEKPIPVAWVLTGFDTKILTVKHILLLCKYSVMCIVHYP